METQEDLNRQYRLSSIIRTYFNDDNDAVVAAIAETTGQKITVRSVQAWQIAPGKVSHRRVPEWALKGLEDYVQRPGKAEQLKERSARREELRSIGKSGFDWSDEVRSKMAVDFATREIESETRERQLWRDSAGKELGNMLFERFSLVERELSSLSQAFGSFLRALDESSDIDELRKKVDESLRSKSLVKYFVRDARTVIERGEAEFSNDEGLPKGKEC